MEDHAIIVACKMCKRKLIETPSCYFVCPWCQTKLYDPMDIANMASLWGEPMEWKETAPELDQKVEITYEKS